MKVMLIDVNCKNSSTGKIIYDLYQRLYSNGDIPIICYGRGKRIKEQNIYKIGFNFETVIHAFLSRVTGLTGFFSPLSTIKLIILIKKFCPDVVHLHELHGYYLNINMLIKYLKKKNYKTVWTFHCEFMYTGKCGYSYDCEKWKNQCFNCPQILEYPKSFYFDFSKQMYNYKKKMFSSFTNLTIVTPSKWLADRVKDSFLKDHKVIVINNGINTEFIFNYKRSNRLRDLYKISDDKVVIAIAPNLMSERKGGAWVVEVAKKLVGLKIKFILVGVASTNKVVGENIISIERTSNQLELSEYYSMADLFIICSKKENFPTTCIEAISCGTPVIGFDEGGTKETAPINYGAFVEYGDIESLCNLIRRHFIGELKFFSRANIEEYGKKHYSIEAMYNKYYQLYISK